jgi:anthranilate phosphoribosyltransferase
MSTEFRELLKKVGSGLHTHKDLSREDSARATEMMLQGIATPAQIGAFLIAHRIKRPTGEELAGMLDTYTNLGVNLQTIPQTQYPLTILGIPYDGRTKTAPIAPITALILACANVPVLMHGGERMPTKYGLTLAEIWQSLGVNFTNLTINQVQSLLEKTNLSFLYLPNHFPLAHNLVQFRDEIGKRPPLATLELIWQPYQGESHLIAGFVHPPTEKMIREALALRGVEKFTLIKGLEGSGDLKLQTTNIILVNEPNSDQEYQYLKLKSTDYGIDSKDINLTSETNYFQELKQLLAREESVLIDSVIWNGGFYLWRCGVCDSITEGIKMSQSLLKIGKLKQKLEQITDFIDKVSS